MFKFFYKYNKLILVVGGSLLMVIFLIGPTIDIFMPNPQNESIGTVDGHELQRRDLIVAEAEIAILERLIRNGQNMNYQLAMQALQPLPQGSENALSWRLQIEEARMQGIHGANARASQLIQDWGVPANVISEIKRGFRVDDAGILQALRHYQMVSQLQTLVLSGQVPSEVRTRRFAHDMMATVSFDMLPIRAARLTEFVDEPTDQQLQQLYQTYRTQVPGVDSGQKYNFGYLIPAQAKLEYIAVPMDRVRETIEIDEIDARAFYEENPEWYQIPDEPDAEEGDAEGEATEPEPEDEATAEPGTAAHYKAVRSQVFQRLRAQRAQEKQTEILQFIQAEMSASVTRHSTKEKDSDGNITGYRTPLDVGELIDFSKIVSDVQERFGVLVDVQRYENRWLTPTDIENLPGLGAAILDPVRPGLAMEQRVTAAKYVESAKEFDPDPDNPATRLRLQVGVPSAVLRNAENTAFVLRLIDAQAARPPKSLDEVRDRVVQDAKLVAAYEQLVEQADARLERAQSAGIEAYGKTLDQKLIPVRDTPRFGAQLGPDGGLSAPRLPEIGRSAEFMEQLFTRARRIMAAEADLEDVPGEQKIFAWPSSKTQTLYLVELTNLSPVTEQQYAMMRGQWPMYLMRMQQTQMMREVGDPFSAESVARRIGFTSDVLEIGDEDEAEPEAEADEPTTDDEPAAASSS